jgi:homoserine kinase
VERRIVLIRSYDPLDVIELPSPTCAHVTVLSPNLELRTSDARKVLKRSVSLGQAISQWGNTAALIASIYKNDLSLMGRSLEDTIIEPERAQLIPGYTQAKRAALEAGAAGASISGSGPSMFALSGSPEAAEKIGNAMRAAFTAAGVDSHFFISGINSIGPTITHHS